MARGFTITKAGKKLLAELVATKEELNITRVMVGKGEVQQGQIPEQFTDLIQPVAQATSTIPVVKNGVISFIVEYRNDLNGGLQEGFWLKEFGVFAQDGEKEILLYYASLGEYPQYIEVYENGKVNVKKYPVSIVVTDDIKVTIAYAALAFVTEERMKEFVEIEALPYLEDVLAESENSILAELDKKADKKIVEQALNTKVDSVIMQQALDQKANAQEVQIALDKKADKETVTQELAKKANAEIVTEELAKKADAETMQQALNQKVDEMEMLTELGKKADKKTLIEELAKKADKEDVQTELDKKVDKEEIEEILQQQIDGANISLELDKKADKETVTEELAKKANVAHEHSADEITDGILPIERGGTGAATAANARTNLEITPANIGAAASSHGTHVTFSTTAPVMDGTAAVGTATTVSRSDHKHPTDTSRAAASHTHNYAGPSSAGGAATSAVKLQTARTLALSGDVTGSASFDGSANKTIAATLANSGVKAGTYGPLELVTKNNGTVWVSNNVGLHSTSAVCTWKAKQTCKVSFRWRVSSESSGTDYLNITAAGTQILANTGGTTEQTGILTATLTANQTIVFTYRKDGSVNNGQDRAEISEVKYGAGTADPSTVIYENNVENYFTITNSTYGFYPGIPIANVTVDTKGRITKEQTTYIAPIHVKKADTAKSASSLLTTLPISKGGTGATSASTALNNLGGFPKSGGRIEGSVAQGNSGVFAQGRYAHGEGYETNANGDYSHAEGYRAATATGSMYSHAEGMNSGTTGESCHAEGFSTRANGDYSHSEGQYTTANGLASHAGGCGTIASANYQTTIGKYNKESTAETDEFIIGNGTGPSARSNCLRVTNANGVYSNSTYKSSGADYAELFQWIDDNPEKEDRVGLFVTLVGERIRIAKPTDKHILGVVSGCPSVLGDVYDDQWKGMYETDIYGRPILEEVEVPAETIEIPDPENPEQTITQVIREAHKEIRQKLNSDFDNTQEYIPRSNRPEWDAVGMLGKLVAIDDGSCEVDGYCTVGEGGIATKSEQETSFYVMARLDKNHIKVMIW